MNLDWMKLSPGMQLFCLFFSMFVGMILGALIIVNMPTDFSSNLALKQVINSVFIFLFPVIVCTLCFNMYSKNTFIGSSLNLLGVLFAILLLLVSFPLMEYLSRISASISFASFAPGLQHFFDNSKELNTEAMKRLFANNDMPTLIINILVIAVTPAIVEEFFFRGCLQTTILKFFKSPHTAIWVVAIIFSIFHLQIDGCITRVVLGALLGYLYYYGGNIIYPIVFHFFNNAIVATAIWKMGVKKAEDFQLFQSLDTTPILLITLASATFIFIVLLLFKKRMTALKIAEK